MADQTITSTAQPWAGLSPYLTDLYQRGQTAQGMTPNIAPQGSLVAPVNMAQRQGNQGMADAASRVSMAPGGFGSNAMDLGRRTTAGEFVDPNSNPYFMPALRASYEPLLKQLTDEIIPGITSAATRQGALDSTSYENLKTNAVTGTTRGISDSIAKAVADQYNIERGRQMEGPGLEAAGYQMSLAPGQTMLQAGNQQQQFEQQPIDAALARYNLDVAAPYAGLDRYSSILGGGGGAGAAAGSRTGTETTAPNTYGNTLSGGVGGAALGGLAGYYLSGASNPLDFLSSGTGIGSIGLGALLGGLGGYFG